MKTGIFLSATGLSLVLTACSSSPATPEQAQAASPPPAQASAAPAPTTAGGQTFSQQELDQLLAPIALYPDALLAQVLMASTYPLEIVAAERWVKANRGSRTRRSRTRCSSSRGIRASSRWPCFRRC